MNLIDTLQEEHLLIDQMLGSLRTYVEELIGGTADPKDGRRFSAFFTGFAGDFHHDREEGVLFEALVEEAELPRDRGPVHALVHEHAEMGEWLREMAPLLERKPQSENECIQLRALATRYSQTLWRHIDAENSVLYPESTERLRRYGIHELPDRPMNDAETAAYGYAEALLARYAPVEDEALTRGEGCFMCRAYGETCDGLEAEWWTDLEWDEFFHR